MNTRRHSKQHTSTRSTCTSARSIRDGASYETDKTLIVTKAAVVGPPSATAISLLSNDVPLPLYHKDDVPDYMVSNVHILDGYRANYSSRMCIQSLFAVHNETGNVWTHVLGALFFVCASIGFFSISRLGHPMHAIHWAMFLPFSVAAVACMSLSALFHLFSGHYHRETYQRLLTLDYMGITGLAVCSFLPPMYLAFQCAPNVRLLYLSLIGVVGVCGILGPMCEFWGRDSFHLGRLVVYVSMGVCGVFPMVHVRYVIPNGASSPYLTGLALMMFFYASGTLLYLSKVPERWFPGRFDIWGHSHQLWHLLVFLASATHFVNCAAMYVHLEEMSLHC